MNWIMLVLAGLCECGFAFCLGKANIAVGGRQILWYAVFVILYALSMVLLGILVFREPATFWRLLFTFTLIASIIGLKVVQ